MLIAVVTIDGERYAVEVWAAPSEFDKAKLITTTVADELRETLT